jgi:wyosine [tRNA(Phe)-imidazoG37] synthetase (radical SAM superfamily)
LVVSGRKEYVSADKVISELKSWMKAHPAEARELKFVTLSGFGEPTLNTCIGELIGKVREITHASIAVITNSTLLSDAQVRKALLDVDLIVPSLDAADPEIFRKIDRPHESISLDKVIQGLVALRKEFKGKIWLEVMLIAGINDDPQHIEKLNEYIKLINPDRIQLNSPVRSTAENDVQPVEKNKLAAIRAVFGSKAEII